MKKFLLALAILPILAFVSCSSDDDDNNAPDVDFDYSIELLYGEWRATEVEIADIGDIDLTDPELELLVAPSYVTFSTGGVFESEGILGDGTGKYITKDKTITTSLGDEKISFKVISLSATEAKIEINAKALGLPMIPEGIETVVVELTKDYPREIDFDFDIALLYGEWQVTAVELGEIEIDVTSIIDPTFVTFAEKGVFSSKGILSEGTGRYAVKGNDIATMIDGEIMSFDMKALSAETAKIEIDASNLDIDIIPEGIEDVIVILTKQSEEE